MSNKYKKDALGQRMKDHESRFQNYLIRRAWHILRLDIRAGHSYFSKCDRPYDLKVMEDIDATAMYLAKSVDGSAYTFQQSDEISILFTDFTSINTQLWFNGNIQKIVSISAALASTYFNQLRFGKVSDKLAVFDARVFSVSSDTESKNHMVWRQKDCERNSLSSHARSLYSHKQLDKKKSAELHELIHQKEQNWALLPERFKRGGMTIYKDEKWQTIAAPIFTQEPNFLRDITPLPGF